MARLRRCCPVGIPQHAIQRGNNRRVRFTCDKDRAAYAHWLFDASTRYGVLIHAWVFMTNHIHLLATPTIEGGLSHVDGDLLAEVRYALNKGLVLGTEKFRSEVEAISGQRLAIKVFNAWA